MANLMELSNTQRNIIPADQHRPAKLIQPPLHQHHPELAQTTSGSGIAATEEWPEGTMPTAGDQDPTANGEPTLHVRRGLAMARHGVGLEGADAASFPSSNLTYNKDGERLLVPRVGGHELGQLRLELLQQRLGSGSNALLTGPLDNNNLPELRIDGHLVQVIADLIHRLQSSTNKVYIALRANNETEAGDDPVARAQLVEALALLQQCRNPLLYVDKFLRDCEQPILQELANALSAAASHSRATLEATPLLLDAAAAMQSCARRLRTERLTVATRNFLQNARLQFASCCQARDWELLGGLVQIYKLLRFSATGAGFNSDQDKAKISKVHRAPYAMFCVLANLTGAILFCPRCKPTGEAGKLDASCAWPDMSVKLRTSIICSKKQTGIRTAFWITANSCYWPPRLQIEQREDVPPSLLRD